MAVVPIAGNLVAKLQGFVSGGSITSGEITVYEYDSLRRLSKVKYNYSSAVWPLTSITISSPDVSYQYDAGSSLKTQMVDSSGTSAYTYDLRGRLATYSPPLPSGYSVAYSYNNSGDKTQVLVKLNSVDKFKTDYSYFKNGWLKLVTGSELNGSWQEKARVTFLYDAAGRRTAVNNANGSGVQTAIAYNSRSETRSVAHATGSVLYALQYARDAAGNPLPWTIVYWHYPPYTRGSYDSDVDPVLKQMREVFVPLLETYGADLLLCGHSHSYERSCLLDGHYSAASTLTPAMLMDPGDGKEEGNGAYHKAVYAGRAHKGTVYVVNGACAYLGTGMPLNHPVMKSSLAVIGNMEIDVNGNRLDARYINTSGQIADHFTIIKETELAVSSPGAARRQPDGIPVRLISDVTVSLVDAPGAFYVEALDRSSGIRAETSGQLPSVGARGTISGVLTTLETGERALSGAVFTSSGDAPARPLNITCRSIGGQGCVGDIGNLTNQGLLVRVTGRVMSVDPEQSSMRLDDGSGIEQGGIEVTHVPGAPQSGQMVSVVGAVGVDQTPGGLVRVIRARDQGIAGDFSIHE